MSAPTDAAADLYAPASNGGASAATGVKDIYTPPTPSQPFWLDQPMPWDTFVIGGATMPGRVAVHVTRDRRIDHKKPQGADGATISPLGLDPATVEVDVEIWTAAQWAAMENILKTIIGWPKAVLGTQTVSVSNPITGTTSTQTVTLVKNPPTAIDCSHPKLAAFGVTSLFLQRMEWPDMGKRQDLQRLRFHFIEFKPSNKATGSTVTTSAPATSTIASVKQTVTATPINASDFVEPIQQPSQDPQIVGPHT